MAKVNEAHAIVMESLTEALLCLLEKKPLKEINVSMLCEKAGVSRISFYRNYQSMDDILIQHLTYCTEEWWKGMLLKAPDQFFCDFWPGLLAEYRKNRRLIQLLYQNDAAYILKDHIFTCCGPTSASDENDAYLRAALAGTFYGIVDEWVRRGMGDLPEGFRLMKVLDFAKAQGLRL